MSAPQWTPEIVVDAERARAMIVARFPELRAERVERLGHGWDNAAYLVDGKAVFRFPQRSVAAPLVATEIAVLPAIATEVPLAIPVPHWVGEPDETYPWRFAGYPLLAGTPFDVAQPGEAARAGLARPLGAFLRALHALDPVPLVAAGLGPDVIGRMDPVKRLPQARARLATVVSAGAIDASDAAELLALFERDMRAGRATRLALVHGDLYARHLLVDEHGTLTAIIDWGDMHHGDPAVDLSVAHEILPSSEHLTFLAAYGPVDAATWRRARWRAIHHAALLADYGMAIGDDALARGGLDAFARILSSAARKGQRRSTTRRSHHRD